MAASITDFSASMRTAWARLLSSLSGRSAAVVILWINIATFVLLRIVGAVSVLSGHEEWLDGVLSWSVEVPSDVSLLLTRPWTLLTYMFAQYEVWHALFNLLLFYWFADIFLNIASSRRLWTLYIVSGLGGAVFFIAGSCIFPAFTGQTGWLIGSSAAVLGVIAATSFLCPDYPMMLFFIGEVKLKWVGLATIALGLAGGISGGNIGGNLAHAGGIAAGLLYPLYMRYRGLLSPGMSIRKPQISGGGNPMIAPPFQPSRRRLAPSTRRPQETPSAASDMEQLDAILDKIKVAGYDSLTPRERRVLFEVSSRIKQ